MEKKMKPFVGAKVRIKEGDVYYIVTDVGDETFRVRWGDDQGLDEHTEEYGHNLFTEYDEELVLTPEMVFKAIKNEISKGIPGDQGV